MAKSAGERLFLVDRMLCGVQERHDEVSAKLFTMNADVKRDEAKYQQLLEEKKALSNILCGFNEYALFETDEDEQKTALDLWTQNNNGLWLACERHYWELVPKESISLEKKLEQIDPDKVKNMSSKEFYGFLYNDYFVWKYTAKNRLASTRKSLSRYESNKLGELAEIQKSLFSIDPDNDIEAALTAALKISGLGTAGASGLLAILFPHRFGTVDQFVVRRLQGFKSLEGHSEIKHIDPKAISFHEAVTLEYLFREKAAELNRVNHTDYWTPRKIDKVLWSLYR